MPWKFVGGLAGGGTAVAYTTHDAGEVERSAQRELLFAGTPEDLGGSARDFEAAFVAFLHEHGH